MLSLHCNVIKRTRLYANSDVNKCVFKITALVAVEWTYVNVAHIYMTKIG